MVDMKAIMVHLMGVMVVLQMILIDQLWKAPHPVSQREGEVKTVII